MNIMDVEVDAKKLSKNEAQIAEFVSKNLTDILYMNTQEIADRVGVSVATVSRFWKRIGFESFADFKKRIRRSQQTESPAGKMKNIIARVDSDQVFNDLTAMVNQNLAHTAEVLDDATYSHAIDILAASKRIYTYASGAALTLNAMATLRFNRLGYQCTAIQGQGTQILEALINCRPDDVMLIFSFSHVRQEQRVLVDFCKKHGIQSILITDLFTSELIADASVTLHVERGEIWEFHSMVPPLLMLESIIVSLALRDEDKAMSKLEVLSDLRETYKKELPR